MLNNSTSTEDFFINTSFEILKIKKNKKITDYNEIKNKTKFIKSSSNYNIFNTPKLYSEKIIKKNEIKPIIISNNEIKIKIDTYIKEKLKNKKNRSKYQKDRIDNINIVSSKVNNLIYSKINLIDFTNFNIKYYYSGITNILTYKTLKRLNNLSNINDKLNHIYYEYANRNFNIKFNSNFELGNLNLVYKTKIINEFDLILGSDKNMELSTGWFYFSIQGAKRGQRVKFNIINLVRNKSLYDKKKIAIKSTTNSDNINDEEKILNDWKYLGENIEFKKSNHNEFYSLSFEYIIRYENEIVYFAENIPYNLNRNENLKDYLLSKMNNLLKIKINSFDSNLTGYKNYYYSITSNNDICNKPTIVLLSRIQPSHNCSSYVLEGMIKYLLEIDNISIEYLLDNYELIIIPFLSFEMVAFGNTRHTISGVNLNDNINTDSYSSKEFMSFRNLLKSINKRSEIQMIFEIHDNPFKYNYYYHIFSFKEDNIEMQEYNEFLNIMNYNMNFLKKDRTVIINENKKFKYLKKQFNIKFLFQFYVSTYGNDFNEIEFMPQDYEKLGKNIAYSLSLFLAKKSKNRKNVYIKELLFDIDYYFKNINSEEKDLVFKRSDSFGSNDNFFLKNREEMKVNKISHKINQNILKDEEDLLKENKYQKKLLSKYNIQHKRGYQTKKYDYIIKRNKDNKYDIKNKDKIKKEYNHSKKFIQKNLIKEINLRKNIKINNFDIKFNNNPKKFASTKNLKTTDFNKNLNKLYDKIDLKNYTKYKSSIKRNINIKIF